MLDILMLIVAPIVFWAICLVCVIIYINKVATSDKLEHKITKISKRPRVIRDNNHKLSYMNKLMLPEHADEFNDVMIEFVKKSLKNELITHGK